jgi:hypothetical protein
MAKKETNPLVGKEVWTLVITNDYEKGETTSAVFTSFQKALDAAETEFKERDLMEYWEDAKTQLRDQFFFRDPDLFNGDRFLIECVKIS